MKEYKFNYSRKSKDGVCTIVIDNKEHNIPNSVFILEKDDKYIVYETNERGWAELIDEFDNLEDATKEAKITALVLISLLTGEITKEKDNDILEKHDFVFNVNGEEYNKSIIVFNEYQNIPFSVFVVKEDNKYIIYENNERGYVQYQKEFDNKEEAIEGAKAWLKCSVSVLSNDLEKEKVLKK